MKILASSGDKVVVQIFLSWWSPWKLLLHNRNKFSSYFIKLVSGKQVGHLTRGENIVQVFEKSFIFDLIVSEDECNSVTLQTCEEC